MTETTPFAVPQRAAAMFDPQGDRFGEVLSRIVHISSHDVYEILEEQVATRKRFGQIALAWGLCEPTHVWQAWSTQILHRTPRVDLEKFGIDAQATLDLPAWLATALGVVPVRSTDDRLVVAASDATLPRATELLTAHSSKAISFVLAEPHQLEAAVRRYYTHITAPHMARHQVCGDPACGTHCANGTSCPTRKRLADAAQLAA
jgi:hypothetical protein